MKKLFTILLCFLMVFSLASCKQNNTLPSQDQTNETPNTTATDDVYDSVIDLYQKAITLCKTYDAWSELRNSHIEALGIQDAQEKEFFMH